MNQIETSIQKTIIFALYSTTLLIAPTSLYDYVNIPKLVMLTIFGVTALLIMLTSIRQSIKITTNLYLILVSLFIIFAVSSSLFSKMSITEAFYGINGRYNGFLTFFMFMILMVSSAVYSSEKFYSKIIISITILGTISAIYGVIQYLSLEPLNPIAKYGSMIGFFGNPNFLSAYLAMTGVATFSLLFIFWDSMLRRLLILSSLAVTTFVLLKINSSQGILIFVFTCMLFFVIILNKKYGLKKISYLLSSMFITASLLSILDIFQISPWKPILYEYSISARGDFWRTAINIGKGNLLNGVGLDGYRDNYRIYRDLVAATRDPSTPVNSSHNLLLDFFVGGGLPLLLVYLLLMFLTFKSAIRNLTYSFDVKYASIFCIWVAYQLQSLVSINQISIGTIGWVLTGVLIGNKRSSTFNVIDINSNQDRQAKLVLLRSGGVFLGLVLTLPLYVSDANFRTSVISGDISGLMRNIDKWPKSVERNNLTTNILFAVNNQEFAERSARMAIKLNPNNFEAWANLYKITTLSNNEKATIYSKLKELDPLNPTLK